MIIRSGSIHQIRYNGHSSAVIIDREDNIVHSLMANAIRKLYKAARKSGMDKYSARHQVFNIVFSAEIINFRQDNLIHYIKWEDFTVNYKKEESNA